MKRKNHELVLPDGYREIYRINALSKRTGLILNLIALGINAIVVLVALIPYFLGLKEFVFEPETYLSTTLIFLGAMLLYIVLHELTHGAAYKILTGEKLTYGFSWSCAFCGVPGIYVYRGASLIAVLAPFVVFTLLFIPLTVAMYFVNSIAYIAAAILLGMHLGGCAGDLYMALLFLFKFKDNKTLVRDTGPEQFFYTNVGTESREEA